jgi:hypothetical protein
MKSRCVRLIACAVGATLVASCDMASTSPRSSTRTGGIGGTGTPTSITIDSLDGVAVTATDTIAIGVGDSLRVAVHLHDLDGLASVTLGGYDVTGAADLGTLDSTLRYSQVIAPVGGANFPTGTKDTVIIRYLQPSLPVDTTAGLLHVDVIAKDVGGDTAAVSAPLVITAGPRVSVDIPTATDSATAGLAMTVTVSVSSTAGLTSLGFRVQGAANWPTPFDATFNQTSGGLSTGTFTALVTLPADATPGTFVTITPFATANGQAASANPRLVVVKPKTAQAPHVTQDVPARAELTDSVFVTATGNGIVSVGFIASDSTGKVLGTGSHSFSVPFAVKTGPTALALDLSAHPEYQGKRILVTSFAVDQDGLKGFSVPATSTASQADSAQAFSDTLLVAYGQTFAEPRPGVMGDLIIDRGRGNVFVSNTNSNRLELWQGATRAFDPLGIAVGSLPWGMTLDNSGDTLLVANSGGTNISKVFVASSNPRSMQEVLSARLLTRSTVAYKVTQSIDDKTGKITITLFEPPTTYSDRPQYVAESKAGRVFYSTRPTTEKPAGTIRWLDPTLAVPDPKQIYAYGKFVDDPTVFAVMNSDSVLVTTDKGVVAAITICDHLYGTNDAGACFSANNIQDAAAGAQAYGGDVVLVPQLDLPSLGLTDTTFVATSGDRTWVAFGEGNTQGGVGRVMMVNDPDPATTTPPFFSPSIPVQDLLNNASESVSGLALDATGQTVAARGSSSYFATVSNPFHLRLQGFYPSFGTGSGIAFHPSANGTLSPADVRLAFVASANGSIEVTDIANYINRGVLPIKANLYGPLRATLPFPGDPADVVLKLFGLTSNGLLVIDLRAGDIRSVP